MLRALLALLLAVSPAQAVLRAPLRLQAPKTARFTPVAPQSLSVSLAPLGTPSLLPTLNSPLPSGQTTPLGPVAAQAPSLTSAAQARTPAPWAQQAAGKILPHSRNAPQRNFVLNHETPDQPNDLSTASFEPLPDILGPAGSGASGEASKSAAEADFAKRTGMRILKVAGESVPYMKTGGLADVVDDVSRGLAAKGHQVTLMLPLYAEINPEKEGMRRIERSIVAPVDGKMEAAQAWHTRRDGVDIVMLEHEEFFGRKGAYGHAGYEFQDNDRRYSWFARAALEATRAINFQPDVIHTHDWHAGLIPAYLKLIYDRDPFFKATKTVLTIHNIAYQGFYDAAALVRAGFSMNDFTSDKLEYYGHFSFLKAGLQFADAITTVSPNYAEQIQTEEFGHGLDGLLKYRRNALSGILNGVDTALYDPRRDPDVPDHYGVNTADYGKRRNKLALQKRTTLRRDGSVPLFAVAARLAHQKGVDLILAAIPEILKRGGQIVISGSGDREYELQIDALARTYPNQVFRHAFDVHFVRLVYAAANFLLMPSLFEPCGLSQRFAHRYGALVLATRTGGLADTVVDIDEDPERGDGFFLRDATAEAMREAIGRAFSNWSDMAAHRRHRTIAMEKNVSWDESLSAYEALYRDITGN
jgi:starch synthase